MNMKKSIIACCLLCLSIMPYLSNAQTNPTLLVVAKVHINQTGDFTFKEWLDYEKEYFDKVTLKNDLIRGTNVLVHYYTSDNSEILFVEAFQTWADIEKAGDKNNELARAAWPDSLKRKAFFDKRNAFYTSLHSDEIRTILPNAKYLPADTTPQVYYVRTSRRVFPKDAKPGELTKMMAEYNQHVTMKNDLLKGYYPSRHLYGADSRDYIESFVYGSLTDMQKANEKTGELVKAHWPDEEKRKAFFDKMDTYFENWHGDNLFRNVPALRKVAP